MVTARDKLKELEHPTLSVGMMGFPLQTRIRLERLVTKADRQGPAWQVAPFWEADAWWINGSSVSLLADGNLRVQPGLRTERTLNLRLQELNRPIAFSTPLASNDFEATCTFNPDSEPGIEKVLHQFENRLQPLLFNSALGALIIAQGTALRGGIYHVRNKATLLAVLDLQYGKAAILPKAKPADLKGAVWDKRPPAAHDLPESFIPCTPAQLVWSYVRHTSRDLLPARYRTAVVYYRHVPRVPMGWLKDTMLRILSVLSTDPCDFAKLHLRTGIPEATLARDLACLYYAGAVTTTPFKAASATFTQQTDPTPRATTQELDSIQGRSTLPPLDSERTAPAMLYPGQGPKPGR